MPELKNIVLPATLLFLLLAMTVLFHRNGLTEDTIRQMIRVTAASSMVLFSLTFSASSLHHFFSNGRWQPVMQARRRLGLSFALSHAVHLLAIIALVEVVFGGDYSKLGDIVGGSVIYLFIFAMAATSNNASVKLLGAKNWKRLHKTGSYLILIGLFSSYLRNAQETGALHYWLYFALGVGLLLLRIWAFWDKRVKERSIAI
jgi:DMSO/TMAO reductase YedYZ heme-binding membrane subunit